MSFFVKMEEETMEESMVLYMRRTGEYGRENYALMDRFKAWLKEHHLLGADAVILAVPLDNPHITAPSRCRYDVCMVDAESRAPGSDRVKSRRLDGGKYVVFLIEHTAKAVERAWAECFTELEKHGYLPDMSRPVMERYAKKMVDHHYCELCVPVF